MATGGAAGYLEEVPLNCEDLCHADFFFPMRNSPWLGNLGKIFLNDHFHVSFGSVIFLSDSSPEAMNVCVRDLEGQGHDITKHCGLSSALNFAKSHHKFSYLPSESSWPMDRPWLAERTIDEVWVGGTIPQHGSFLISWIIYILFFHILGIVIPTDFHIFQRGWNHQPDIRIYIYIPSGY